MTYICSNTLVIQNAVQKQSGGEFLAVVGKSIISVIRRGATLAQKTVQFDDASFKILNLRDTPHA